MINWSPVAYAEGKMKQLLIEAQQRKMKQWLTEVPSLKTNNTHIIIEPVHLFTR